MTSGEWRLDLRSPSRKMPHTRVLFRIAHVPRPHRRRAAAVPRPARVLGRHLPTCRSLWRSGRADESFHLAGIITHIEPPEGQSFRVTLDRVFVYVQLWGDQGEYFLRVRLVRVQVSDDDEEEIQLAENDKPREVPIPSRRPVSLSGLTYVDELGFPIGPVGFREPGLYEYQLWADGIDEPVAREARSHGSEPMTSNNPDPTPIPRKRRGRTIYNGAHRSLGTPPPRKWRGPLADALDNT